MNWRQRLCVKIAKLSELRSMDSITQRRYATRVADILPKGITLTRETLPQSGRFCSIPSVQTVTDVTAPRLSIWRKTFQSTDRHSLRRRKVFYSSTERFFNGRSLFGT